MSTNFSDECRQVMLGATQMAQEAGQEYVGTEPMLMLLVQDEGNAVVRLCRSFGIEPQPLREALKPFVRSVGPPVTGRSILLTPPAQQVLESAQEEATNLGHSQIDGRHLLLAMLRQAANGVGVAGTLLMQMGMDYSQVKQRIVSENDWDRPRS